MRRVFTGSLVLALALGCASEGTPAPMAVRVGPCPEKPNCVSSLAEDADHRVAPFLLNGPNPSWSAVRAAVAAMPRTAIVEEGHGYLHAECTSRIFRFVDDLELLRNEAGDRVDVRSASRVGYGDMGVNRERVEKLRRALVAGGAVLPQPK
jgi:uncharacterized protein (DUF1499 family)